MNVLVFENILSGHRLEYIHHLFVMSAAMPENEFYFVLSDEFDKVKSLFEWPSADNIHIETVSDGFSEVGARSIKKLWNRQKKKAQAVNSFVEKYNIDAVFSILLMEYFPFAPVFLKRDVRIDGILYGMSPWQDRGRILRAADSLKYSYMEHCPRFGNIYVLNDRHSVSRLNHGRPDGKFKFLPDPFMPIPEENTFDFRERYGIPGDKILFAHFGGLTGRKGTMLILESLHRLSPDCRSKYVFVFAGKVYDDIRERFYREIESLSDKADIIVQDMFCPYEYLASLCKSSDALLMPYLLTTQSSGLIGYASQFGVPVVAPSKNLLGRLVRENSLGYILPETSADALLEAYGAVENRQVAKPTREYCELNSVDSFLETIKLGLNKI